MAVAESRIKKWGNSLGIVISKKAVDELELKEGEKVSVDIVKQKQTSAFGIFRGARPFHREENILDR